MEIEEYLALPLETRRRLLKNLIAETVPRGDVKETAFAAGLEDYTLYKMRDGNRETHDLLRPELIAILHHRRDLRLLHWLLGLFGCVVYRLPRAGEPPQELNRAIARTIKSFGEHLAAMTEALEEESPGGAQITAAEYQEIKASGAAAIARIAALMEMARLARGGKVVKGEEFPVRFGGPGRHES